MDAIELKIRTARLDVNLSADAVKLLRLCVTLATEGKVKNSAMQNEIPQLLQNVEESQSLQKKITVEEKFFNLASLINAVSTYKFSASNKIVENKQKKIMVDKKIDSLVASLNKILREDSALESDFTFINTGDSIKIISYIGPHFETIKIPATIQGREVKSIGSSAFNNIATSKIIIPETVSEIGYNAFKTSSPLKILFKNKNSSWLLTRVISQIFSSQKSTLASSLSIDKNCFATPTTLFCENISTEKILKNIFAGNSQVKFNSNIAAFFGNHKEIFSYYIKTTIIYLLLLALILTIGIAILPYAAMAILIALIVGGLAVVAGISGNNSAICLIYVAIAGLLLYNKGGDFFNYAMEYRNSAVDFAYEKFNSNEDRYAFKVGNFAVRLNNSSGVEKTVVNYNSTIQGLYESSLQKNLSADAEAYKNIFIKSIAAGENAIYTATLNNDDYIYFKTDADGYILSAEIFIREDHTSISKPVLNNLIKSAANVEIKNSVLQKVLDEIISGEKNSAFYSIAANRNFKISQGRYKNFFKFTVQAFMK